MKNNMIYLSGSISGTLQQQSDNISQFNKKERELVALGLKVHNPVRNYNFAYKWENYLARDLEFIFKNKPDLFMLEGWENSLGAKLEHALAKRLGLKIIYE